MSHPFFFATAGTIRRPAAKKGAYMSSFGAAPVANSRVMFCIALKAVDVGPSLSPPSVWSSALKSSARVPARCRLPQPLGRFRCPRLPLLVDLDRLVKFHSKTLEYD